MCVCESLKVLVSVCECLFCLRMFVYVYECLCVFMIVCL